MRSLSSRLDGDETLVGMAAVIPDGAVLGPQCLVGAKALVPQGAHIPEGSLVMGIPAKIVRPLTKAERQRLRRTAERYAINASFCRQRRNLDWPIMFIRLNCDS